MPENSHSRCATRPGFVLALLLWAALAAGGLQALQFLHWAPSTLVPAAALTSKPSPRGQGEASPTEAAAPASGPGWETLSTEQKRALYPLAERWASLNHAQKKYWLTLATTFHALPQSEQDRLHARMTDWASLSAQQRNQARLNYAGTSRLAPKDKLERWKAYQALSEEEKRRLAARAAAKPQGAAPALRPAPSRKLVQVPAALQASPNRPNPPKISPPKGFLPRLDTVVPAPAAAPFGGATPAPVETAPVDVPVAVPMPLPPLSPMQTAPEGGAAASPGAAPASR
ncbi:DUF3106 domain-containing protein [Extensimonas sp. H3M7-6]|uniref:DUF3106 domain-containing protein n=1 Tax=Extensimonas soli TaxID=3031322 RepID=UPI0023DB86D5|nr:DUF3106 domain-containing protein [Extensimonas sp. H3M7-6]MDF1483373.1 DUF3106 domain-containing protein [Extensimonas sp. H3M7-6]